MVSTRKLVDSREEQELLEQLIEQAKPPVPPGPEFQNLHWLLYTPFRYPPLKHGSRFGPPTERGIWYGSVALPTALAETAYYRLLFLEGTTAPIERIETQHSAFRAGIHTQHGVDLCRGLFAQFQEVISSPIRYDASQSLGQAMRTDHVEAFQYASARDPEHRPNVGVLSPRAFATRKPDRGHEQTWHCVTTRQGASFDRLHGLRLRDHLGFSREAFLVDDRLPACAI